MRETSQAVNCRCGHDRSAHRHYRHGSDCALCDCTRWSGLGWLSRMFRSGLR